MNRRRFVQAGASSLFMPGAMVAVSADAAVRDALACDYFFFDERFAGARSLAGELSGRTEPTPVQGDVTRIWTGKLARASRATPLTMQGVTTESFYFCLKVLLADQARVEAQVRRIGQDLHYWTIRTNNHSRNGPVS